MKVSTKLARIALDPLMADTSVKGTHCLSPGQVCSAYTRGSPGTLFVSLLASPTKGHSSEVRGGDRTATRSMEESEDGET